jgi:hypothetical protein
MAFFDCVQPKFSPMNSINDRIADVTPLQFLVLETVDHYGPCSTVHIAHLLGESAELFLVMRCLARLADKGFVRQVTINNSNFYETTPVFTSVRDALRVLQKNSYYSESEQF